MPSPCINNWISNKKENTENINSLVESGYSPIFIQLLSNRGITGINKIRSYLYPSLKNLHQPELVPNIEEAAARVKEAISKKENILIFGDYDTDGIISTAMMYNFFKDFNISADYYIPDRFTEGYDISIDFIKKNDIEKKYDLIICVDCGSNASDVQEYVLRGKLDIDVIACDHHEVMVKDRINPLNTGGRANAGKKTGGRANCYIIMNPKYPGSSYPFKMLSGGGVTFKFIWSILKNTGLQVVDPGKYLRKMLDLVAITTVSDLMPLTDENRIIVNKGLKIIRNTINNGLRRLIENSIENVEDISTYHIGFIISPRLNASGRMEDACDSLKILINDDLDEEETDGLIKKVESLNRERQILQQSILDEIERSHDFDMIKDRDRVFISKSSGWSEGVLGVVASDIVKKYNIPVILFKDNGGILRGSGRSIESFDIYKNLELLKEHFMKFGGHQHACGITMKAEKYESFKKRFIEIACSRINTGELKKRFYYDMEIRFNDIDLKLLEEIRSMEPFGIGNKKPLFLTTQCLICSKISQSRNKKHAFFRIKNSNRVYNAVVFNFRDSEKHVDGLSKGRVIDVLYNIESYNNYNKKDTGPIIVIQSFR